MAATSNTFTIALEFFISDLKRDEDTRSPFYKEVLSQLHSNAVDRPSQEVGNRSSEQLALFVKHLDEKQKRKSHTRRVAERLEPLLSGLSQYTKACDVMIQAGPAAATLIYGGARIVLLLAEGFRKCFEDVLSIMETIGNRLKCYHLFAKAYDASADMQQLLVNTYKNIVSFWHRAAALFSRKAYKTLLTGIVKPLDAEWQRFRQILEGDEKKVQMLAQATDAEMRRERRVERSSNQQAKLRDDIVNWIKASQEEDRLDVRQDIRIHLETRHDDTCEWLFQHPDMEKWLVARKSTSIWYSAPPGAGKTILSSAVVRKLQDKGQRTATFFCSFNDLVRKKVINVLRALALQLLSPSDPIPEKVKRLYEEDLRNHCSKLNDSETAIDVVEALLKQQSRIHVIVDGLDECENPEMLLLSLCRLLHSKTYGIVKWFLASRPDSDIRTMMRKHSVTEIEASPESLMKDIKKYVTDHIHHDCEWCVEYWTTKSEGNFMWVRQMMAILDGEGTTCEDEIDEELNKFPKGLTGCYMRTLSRLVTRPERHQQLARSIFTMLVGAIQPLHLSELTHALAASKGMEDFSTKCLPKPELIEELCSNLVIFDRTAKGTEGDPLLKVAHKSIQDFFVQDPDTLQVPDERLRQYFVSSAKANLELGLSALSYLNYERYHTPQDVSTIITADEHSFLRHAATFWHRYLSNAECSADLYEKVIKFVRSKAFWACVAVQTRVVPYLFARYTKDGGRFFGGYHPEATGPKPKKQCADDVYFAIPLPNWLDREDYGSDGPRTLAAFYRFVTEWHPVLNSLPEAVSQCVMDQAWEESLPGRVPWREGKVKVFALSHSDAASDAPVDVQLGEGSLDVLVMAREKSPGQYHTKWVSLGANTETAPPHPPACRGRAVSAVLSPHSQFFSGNLDIMEEYWLVNTSRLTVRHYSKAVEGGELSFPETISSGRTTRAWHLHFKSVAGSINGSTPSRTAAAFHFMQEPPEKSDTFSVQSSQESGYGSMNPSDIESDSETDDASSDGEEHISQHCMLVVRERGAPLWHFWRSKIDMDAVCAFHPTEATAVWSQSAHQLCMMDLESGKIQSTVLPEPVDAQFSSIATMRKEFKFSETEHTLYYLLYTATKSDTGFKQSLSLSSFLYCDSQDAECVLERTHPTISVAYESAGAIEHPLVLTYWNSDFLYVVLPPLSCNAKIVRMRLPKRETPSNLSQSKVQTLRDPVYFPYSTPYRNPQLKLLPRVPGMEMLVLVLDAEFSSNGEPEVTKSPAVMTWSLRSQEDWRDWNEELDTKNQGVKANEEIYELLRGNYLDRGRKFEVPVRSGLDWRRKAFLSCH